MLGNVLGVVGSVEGVAVGPLRSHGFGGDAGMW